MEIIIDFDEMEKLIDKKIEGRNVPTDQIAKCVSGSRFDPENGYSTVMKDVYELFKKTHLPYSEFDNLCVEFFKKHGSKGKNEK